MSHRVNYPCSGKSKRVKVSFKRGRKRVSFYRHDCHHKAGSKKQAAWWKKFGAAGASCANKAKPGTKAYGTCMKKAL